MAQYKQNRAGVVYNPSNPLHGVINEDWQGNSGLDQGNGYTYGAAGSSQPYWVQQIGSYDFSPAGSGGPSDQAYNPNTKSFENVGNLEDAFQVSEGVAPGQQTGGPLPQYQQAYNGSATQNKPLSASAQAAINATPPPVSTPQTTPLKFGSSTPTLQSSTNASQRLQPSSFQGTQNLTNSSTPSPVPSTGANSTTASAQQNSSTSSPIPGVPGGSGAPGTSASEQSNAPSPSMATGGVVPDAGGDPDATDNSGGNIQTGDLSTALSTVQNALTFGRQKVGLSQQVQAMNTDGMRRSGNVDDETQAPANPNQQVQDDFNQYPNKASFPGSQAAGKSGRGLAPKGTFGAQGKNFAAGGNVFQGSSGVAQGGGGGYGGDTELPTASSSAATPSASGGGGGGGGGGYGGPSAPDGGDRDGGTYGRHDGLPCAAASMGGWRWHVWPAQRQWRTLRHRRLQWRQSRRHARRHQLRWRRPRWPVARFGHGACGWRRCARQRRYG